MTDADGGRPSAQEPVEPAAQADRATAAPARQHRPARRQRTGADRQHPGAGRQRTGTGPGSQHTEYPTPAPSTPTRLPAHRPRPPRPRPRRPSRPPAHRGAPATARHPGAGDSGRPHSATDPPAGPAPRTTHQDHHVSRVGLTPTLGSPAPPCGRPERHTRKEHRHRSRITMPKMKTHSGAKKRFRITGTGKVMREQAGGRHLLERKSCTQMRSIADDVELSKRRRQDRQKLLGR